MKKIIIITLIILTVLGIIGGYYIYYDQNIKQKNKINDNPNDKIALLKQQIEGRKKFEDKSETGKIEENPETEVENKENILPSEKLNLLKEQISLKGLIANGDMYSEENNLMGAIITYKKALKKDPQNDKLNQKIGDLYYEMKSFNNAYYYYKNIKNQNYLNIDKLIKSLINSQDIDINNINPIKSKINSLNISKEKKYYYETSLNCLIDYSKCREEFEKYFAKNNNIKDENLKNLKNALENFKNFQSDDLYYKTAFIGGAFYENAFYYLSLKTAKEVLNEKGGYKPMLKVAAKSAYEIGKYKEAKNFLQGYKKLDQNDPEINYFLARVYEKLNDKVLSIVHYEKALSCNYEDKADIYRRLVFIYFERRETKKMLEQFNNLVNAKKENLNFNDFNLAIYYNILNNDLEKAKDYSKKAIKYFPENYKFYAYQAWILLQKENLASIDFKMIKENIDKGFQLDKNNPMLLMIKGIYNFKQEKFNESIIFLKRAYGMDKTAEYKSEIRTWLDKAQKAKKDQNNKNN